LGYAEQGNSYVLQYLVCSSTLLFPVFTSAASDKKLASESQSLVNSPLPPHTRSHTTTQPFSQNFSRL